MSLMFLPHFDVLCDLLLDRCTATWNLFVLYHKKLNSVPIKAALFHVRRESAGGLPDFDKHEKSYLASSMIYTKGSNLIGCYAKQRIAIGPGKSRHCQTCFESRFSWNENLQWNQN